jgi:hypothetical protein
MGSAQVWQFWPVVEPAQIVGAGARETEVEMSEVESTPDIQLPFSIQIGPARRVRPTSFVAALVDWEHCVSGQATLMTCEL